MTEQKSESPLAIRVAVLGAGKMGGALVRGWIAAGTLRAENIRLRNRRYETAQTLADETGVVAAASLEEALRDADVVVLGVKPYGIAPILEEARPFLPSGCLVVSVAAGVTTAKMEAAAAPAEQPVIRVMTNTAALIGEGAAGFCRGRYATDDHAHLAETLFAAAGSVHEVTEPQIDAVLGVSSSGIAYFYLLIEALADGGVRAGLPRDAARTLAAQTALGAAKMILETGEHPAALKDAVTTPGGTTIAALEVLEKAAVRGALIGAVVAARDRAVELG